MNIAFFYVSKVQPTAGGIERVTYNLTEIFQRRGHNVYNIFYNGEEDGITNFKIPKPDDFGAAAKKIDEIVKALSIDIIIDQYSFDSNLTHLKLCSNVKIVRCIHVDPCPPKGFETEMLLSNFNFYQLKQSLMNVLFWFNTPRRLSLSRKSLYNRSLGVDRFVLLDDDYSLPSNIDSSIVRAIPNGVHVKNHAVGDKKKQILFVGRLEHTQKNTRFLVRLWKELYIEFPDWEFIVCGKGPDLPVMQDYVRRNNLDRIYFKGQVDPTQYYKDASIVLLPSFYEGFGMVLIEGMQYGCIPIVFDVCSAFHKICKDGRRMDQDGSPRQCGVIVKAMDKKAYVEACRHLMCDSRLRRSLSLAANEHVADYDLEKIADKWELMFSELFIKE